MTPPRESTRRQFLHTPLAAGLLLPAASGRIRPRPREGETLGLDEFGMRWLGLVEDSLAGEFPFVDEVYLAQLAALAHQLRRQEIPELRKPGYSRDGLSSGGIWGDGEVGLVAIQLEPGAVVPAHNHVAYNFLTMCVKGDCEARHYRPAEGAPAPEPQGTSDWFRVEEVKATLLEPGRVTSLTRTWDNIHWFRAGKHGATLVDFMTHLPDAGDGYRAFSALEIEEPKKLGNSRRPRARWIGNPFRQ